MGILNSSPNYNSVHQCDYEMVSSNEYLKLRCKYVSIFTISKFATYIDYDIDVMILLTYDLDLKPMKICKVCPVSQNRRNAQN